MTLFLGYDPGGKGKHGIAAAEIGADGTFVRDPETWTLATAKEVVVWLRAQPSDSILGIDTLLAWSLRGERECDRALRCRYPANSATVISQNSLYSSMTLNGIMVAQEGKILGLDLVETHPKLLMRTAPGWGSGIDNFDRELKLRYLKLSANSDHSADALVAAWCASRWWYERWSVDLFYDVADDLIFPAGEAHYPWPEPVPQSMVIEWTPVGSWHGLGTVQLQKYGPSLTHEMYLFALMDRINNLAAKESPDLLKKHLDRVEAEDRLVANPQNLGDLLVENSDRLTAKMYGAEQKFPVLWSEIPMVPAVPPAPEDEETLKEYLDWLYADDDLV